MRSSSNNLLNSQQGYPLHLACEEGDLERVKTLLKKKYDISGYDDKHWTPLHCAANNRQLLMCKHLLKLGASATAVTSNNATPLHYLARLIDHAELLTCLKLLIEKGADVNHLTYQQISPLHEASSRGSVIAASFLLDNGARIDQVNSFGETPLHLAVRTGKMEMVELLLRKGARAEIVGKEGTALELAERFLQADSLDQFKLLCEKMSFGVINNTPVRQITNFNGLPVELQTMAQQARIRTNQIDANFDLFLDIVRYSGGERFLPPKPDQKVPIIYSDPYITYAPLDQPFPPLLGKEMIVYAVNKQTNKQVMIKRLAATNRKELKYNVEEIELLYKLQSPSIIPLIDAYYLPNDKEHWMVMERLEGMFLKDVIKQFSESEIAFIISRILEIVNELHTKYIAHRDINSSKFFLETNGNIRIVDFGSAVNLCKSIKVKYSGTPFWMAPEIIKQEPQSTAVDIWSLGITIIEIANGAPPNANNKLKALFAIVTEGITFDDANWSKEMSHFIGECLKINPDERQTTSILLKHKWLNSTCSKENFCTVLARLKK